jgi:beta-lactam-binding protein with PASTA domain
VVGLSRQDAASQLRGLGFVVEQRAEDSDADKDQVLTQDPSSGAEVDKGSTVTITYSNGAGTITLGDFVGQKLTYAQRKLGGQGLSVSIVKRTVTDSSQDGIVLQQAPPAGSNLSPGDRVTLTVGEFIAPPTPPGGSTTTTTP